MAQRTLVPKGHCFGCPSGPDSQHMRTERFYRVHRCHQVYKPDRYIFVIIPLAGQPFSDTSDVKEKRVKGLELTIRTKCTIFSYLKDKLDLIHYLIKKL